MRYLVLSAVVLLLASKLGTETLNVQSPGGVQPANPIDTFHKANKGQRSTLSAADRAALIRRAKLHFQGIEPPPEETDAPMKDDEPNAYELMIDRLLAVPESGEKTGRGWLGTARYSYGKEPMGSPANTVPYRDWVIEMLNAEKSPMPQKQPTPKPEKK